MLQCSSLPSEDVMSHVTFLVQGVLLKFQEVMKEAKRREAASLPIALSQTPASSSGAAPPPESTAIDIEKQAAQKSNERAQVRVPAGAAVTYSGMQSVGPQLGTRRGWEIDDVSNRKACENWE